ncbi:hypothetical protein Kpol_480p7 [Vanderwaltozyma polyspora DSM 70294]|uniref:Nuclear control of ATPase protein 2 n=1 Tax=Vanderwaltozyma polyspora (strain ATCC 22028 / DSM 70294 / BCRC 21397 / CBS 2163 / NBRC 10782 / NRRL Y-8283 / UCD 57-17) TaxID=436907 RepID=A7TP69_VANPO|nr:uncharacterized protein Kpol_480p7 [Vanderwaltozyma polyspora DSM 70294]EDO15920.1 hypothetical protein Kpol_480p7 [Vanderwaltozyma polyspora DSM 70294]
MLTDTFCFHAIQVINGKLETALEQISLHPEISEIDALSSVDLQQLQDQLARIKKIAESVSSQISKKTGKKVKVDFNAVKEVILNIESLPKTSNPLQELIYNAISEYAIVLCYHGLTIETVSSLIIANDVGAYYKSVADSSMYTLLYGIQVTPKLVISLINDLVTKIKTKLHRLESNHQFTIASARGFTNDIIEEIRPKINNIMMVQSLNIVGLPNKTSQRIKVMINFPRLLIRSSLHKKIENIDSISRNYTIKLGNIINEFQTNKNEIVIDENIKILQNFLEVPNTGLYEIIDHVSGFCKNNELRKLKKPSRLTRYWPGTLFSLVYGSSSIIMIWNSRYKIIEFLQKNVVEFMSGLIHDWIWQPLKQVWATVRHDEDTYIAMMSKDMLPSELNSLTRMVVSFVADNSKVEINVPELTNQIEEGNLTQFMEIYENQLEHPVKNLVKGKLIRSLLIQVQKTKVDGSLALNGIDKMLKSQQLVFEVLAISPALLIMYSLVHFAYKLVTLGSIWTNYQKIKMKLTTSINTVERILNYEDIEDNLDDKFYHQGLLTIEVSNMFKIGSRIIPKWRKDEWRIDVEELINYNLSCNSRLNVINRIYHVYGNYF